MSYSARYYAKITLGGRNFAPTFNSTLPANIRARYAADPTPGGRNFASTINSTLAARFQLQVLSSACSHAETTLRGRNFASTLSSTLCPKFSTSTASSRPLLSSDIEPRPDAETLPQDQIQLWRSIFKPQVTQLRLLHQVLRHPETRPARPKLWSYAEFNHAGPFRGLQNASPSPHSRRIHACAPI
ncbi:hypothetical protein B0H16DRAFT_1449258 [Mycena metata]|uniref:Uncharacterized protein n=1 Tax=Mycena metata TaxID=1033252 RepID=A0AAD7NVR4_9AGAR|nr:hypothetical protein B0H16DRAFT_1449258 [Mycena metata]